MPQQVSKEKAHLFEEQNVIDVGIVNEEPPELDPSASAHISSPGRLLNSRSRRNSTTSATSVAPIPLPELDASDGDEVSIATTVSSNSIHDATATDDVIVSQYPQVEFEMQDQQDFITEINDWFVMSDLAKLPVMKTIYQSTIGKSFQDQNDRNQSRILHELRQRLQATFLAANHKDTIKAMISLNYIVMGCYDDIIDESDQKTRILRNLTKLITSEPDILAVTIDIYSQSAKDLLEFNPAIHSGNMADLNMMIHYSSTVLYFTICFLLDSDLSTCINATERFKIKEMFRNKGLLNALIKYTDQWRWLSSDPQAYQSQIKQSFKVRNLMFLISKMILFSFGGMSSISKTKAFLKKKFNDDQTTTDAAGSSSESQYKVSLLDYHYFKADLRMRYPSFIPPDSSLSKETQINLETMESSDAEADKSLPLGSSSMSESLLDEPFSQRRATAASNTFQMPPDVHIATPLPSPTLSPVRNDATSPFMQSDRFNDMKDTKKIFQTVPCYPYLYPTGEDAPKSIREATEIFFNSVKEDINTKQFMSVYESFISQERGIINTIESEKDEFTYDHSDFDKYPEYKDEIESLMMVEDFYKSNLSYFNSLIKVFAEIIISASVIKDKTKRAPQSSPEELITENINKIKFESDQSAMPLFLKQKYEIAKVKETTVKCASQIVHLLLKWFKLSHLLKFEFLTMIIFDNDYYQVCLDFIASNIDESQSYANSQSWFMMENISVDDDELIAQKFGNDELATLKYQFYAEFNSNKMIREEFEIPEYRFFDRCLQLSSSPMKRMDPRDKYNNKLVAFKHQVALLKEQPALQIYGIKNPKIMIYNWKYCFILTHLLNILYYTMANKKTQRVNQLVEKKPTDILKFCLRLQNEHYYRPILKIIKMIIPFNGRKWKSNNMDAISLVYLYYKVGLKDDWLTRNYNNPNLDLAEEFKRSYKQEYSLRSLLQYYNIKYYQKGMQDLGYEYSELDYFNKELEILSRLYIISQGVPAE